MNSTTTYLAATARSFAAGAALAVRYRRRDTETARWHAKQARADWRLLCRMAGRPAPAPHPQVDFAR